MQHHVEPKVNPRLFHTPVFAVQPVPALVILPFESVDIPVTFAVKPELDVMSNVEDLLVPVSYTHLTLPTICSV